MHGERRKEMLSGWGVIQFDLNGTDTEGINRKFDQILTFLAEEVFPCWEQIDCLEAFFAPERQALFQAMLAGPPDSNQGMPVVGRQGRCRKAASMGSRRVSVRCMGAAVRSGRKRL